jgi:hypothetical protein
VWLPTFFRSRQGDLKKRTQFVSTRFAKMSYAEQAAIPFSPRLFAAEFVHLLTGFSGQNDRRSPRAVKMTEPRVEGL